MSKKPKNTAHQDGYTCLNGWEGVVEWFGRFPRCHDAEVTALKLDLPGRAMLSVHAWNMTDQIDDAGYYILEKHAVVSFEFLGLTAVHLSDFELNGIIFDLYVSHEDRVIRVEWESSYGVYGHLAAREVIVTVLPGRPE